MSKSIEDLRASLFDTLQAVKNGDLDLDKARTINEIGKTLIDTARVEVDYLRVVGGGESSFIGATVEGEKLPPGITGIRQHRIKG